MNFSDSTPPVVDRLVRSRRRSIGLEIRHDGGLIVRAPHFVSNSEIERIITSKQTWIRKKQEAALERMKLKTGRSFTSGEKLPYLGSEYELVVEEREGEPLILDGRFMLSKSHSSRARELFRAWYIRRAGEVFEERTRELARQAGVKYGKVSISNARGRWGSCGPSGNLRYNWRVVMAPIEVVDYLVAHEISHIRVKNHSKDFWKMVALLCPEYPIRRKWLRKSGHLLDL